MRRFFKVFLCLVLLGLNLFVFGYWRPYERETKIVAQLRQLGADVQCEPHLQPVYRSLLQKFFRRDMCRRVVGVAVPSASSVNLERLPSYLVYFPYLRRLILEERDVTPRFFARVSEAAPQLQILALRRTNVSAEHIAALNLHVLRILDLRNTAVDDFALSRIGQLKALEHLDVSGTSVTYAGLRHLEPLTALKILDLREVQVPVGPLILQPGAMPSLRELYLAGTRTDDRLLETLLRWAPSVEYLDLSDTLLTDRSTEILFKEDTLRTLNVSRTELTPPAIMALATLPRLELLICDSGLFSVSQLNDLEKEGLIVFAHDSSPED